MASASAWSCSSPTLIGAFEAQVARTPAAVALRDGGLTMSYAELDGQANQLAAWLIERGAGPGELVGVRMPRGSALFVAIYAVLKTGAGYVPFDVELPAERVAQISADCAPLLLLEQLPELDGWPTTRPPTRTLGPRSPSELAYVLYTSGSTGRPKGVAISQRASLNWIAWGAAHYGRGPQTRMLHKTSIGFDVSVTELFGPLQVGGSVVIARPGGHRDLAYLVELIREAEVSDVNFVPSALAAFLAEPGVDACTSLKIVEAAGEALPAALVDEFAARLPGVELHNLYGPTEAGGITAWRCRPGAKGARVPIGAPVWNARAYVLDANMRLLPPGVPGELYLAGAQVAEGYHGQPELSAARFFADPFVPGARMYRSGDLAMWRAEGVLDYVGRADDQIKLRGFRVEPGEIEHALHEHAAVNTAVVTTRRVGEIQALVAYVQPTPGEGVGDSARAGLIRALKRDLGARLPDYMVPQIFVLLAEFPLTSNGKVDKRGLPAPTEDDLSRRDYVAPGTELERGLCRVVAEVLGLGRVGLLDSFFELGGDSLLATRLSLRVSQELGVELPLQLIFGGATLGDLAADLAADRAAAGGSAPASLQPAPLEASVAGQAPLSLQQRELWFLDWPEHLGSACDNIQVAFRIRGRFDSGACARSLAALVERHPILRTSYVRTEAGHVQRVHAGIEVELPVEFAADEAAALAWLAAERLRPFAPADPRVLRAQLLTLADEDHVLVLTRPWGIFDGWSMNIVVSELLALYAAELDALNAAAPEGPDPELAPLPLDYAGFARWQAEAVSRGELDRQRGYWRRQLAGL
ncbi:amino acid adenylation domain-containing protein, partial [Enhygromyxa salina]|uniref:amino acid adenylation domain-containing protein n=1 Tax=Enhygromyxa salina TaxID=215803 RepID=UPI0023E42012